MKTSEESQKEDQLIDESDEFMLHMTEQLNQELKDITVSEDLIAKTLQAVKSEDKKSNLVYVKDAKASVDHITRNKNKSIKIIVNFIKVAAACFLLIVGLRFVTVGGGFATKSDDKCASESKVESDSQESPAAAVEENEKEAFSDDSTKELYTPQEHNVEKPQLGNLADTSSGKSDESLNTTTSLDSKEAVDRIKETLKEEQVNESYIHIFQENSDPQVSTQLLTLLSSDEIRLSSDEPQDEWCMYIIICMDEQSAILYRIGENKYVTASVYTAEGKQSETVYQIKDLEQFHEKINKLIKK